MGILLGTIFASGYLYSNSVVTISENPSDIEKVITEVKVFPNPSDGRFQLTFNYSGPEKITAKVFDITGKQVKDITDDLVRSENSVSANIDLESPSSGIYFIRIERGQSILTKKIVIR